MNQSAGGTGEVRNYSSGIFSAVDFGRACHSSFCAFTAPQRVGRHERKNATQNATAQHYYTVIIGGNRTSEHAVDLWQSLVLGVLSTILTSATISQTDFGNPFGQRAVRDTGLFWHWLIIECSNPLYRALNAAFYRLKMAIDYRRFTDSLPPAWRSVRACHASLRRDVTGAQVRP